MHALATVMLAASSKTTTSTGSSAASLIFILILGVAAYFFFIRPRSKAARAQRDTLMELGVGDEVLTGAGIFGTVIQVDSDRVTIETAPGTRLTVLRSTIARRITSVTTEDAWEAPPEHPDHEDEEHGS